jgi:hypothetical protein
MSTETATKPVTFISKCPNLVLVVEPRANQFNHLGVKIGTTPGKRITFDKHLYSTEDEDELAFLRGHRNFNVPSNQGFYEEGNAPDEPKPTIKQQQQAIETAAAAGDVAALEAVIAEEDATHKREVVYATARAALVALAGAGGQRPANDV